MANGTIKKVGQGAAPAPPRAIPKVPPAPARASVPSFKPRQRVIATAKSRLGNYQPGWKGTVVDINDSDGHPLVLWDDDRRREHKTNPINIRLEEAWLVGNIIVKKGDFIKAKKDSTDGKYKSGETGWISGEKNGYPLVVWMRNSEANPGDLMVMDN